MTRHHKGVFRRALQKGAFTHLLYREDDMIFTEGALIEHLRTVCSRDPSSWDRKVPFERF